MATPDKPSTDDQAHEPQQETASQLVDENAPDTQLSSIDPVLLSRHMQIMWRAYLHTGLDSIRQDLLNLVKSISPDHKYKPPETAQGLLQFCHSPHSLDQATLDMVVHDANERWSFQPALTPAAVQKMKQGLIDGRIFLPYRCLEAVLRSGNENLHRQPAKYNDSKEVQLMLRGIIAEANSAPQSL